MRSPRLTEEIVFAIAHDIINKGATPESLHVTTGLTLEEIGDAIELVYYLNPNIYHELENALNQTLFEKKVIAMADYIIANPKHGTRKVGKVFDCSNYTVSIYMNNHLFELDTKKEKYFKVQQIFEERMGKAASVHNPEVRERVKSVVKLFIEQENTFIHDLVPIFGENYYVIYRDLTKRRDDLIKMKILDPMDAVMVDEILELHTINNLIPKKAQSK